MSENLLELIRLCIQNGDTDDALNLLKGVLRADSRSVPAWELMAMITDDPEKRAECYRRILQIDPDHSIAKAGLDELSGEYAHKAPPEVQQVVDLLRTVGISALDKETIDRFKAMGVELTIVEDYLTISSRGRDVKVHIGSLPASRTYLYPEEIVRHAGQPLPPTERKICPHCQATIPRAATRCSWCSKDLD
jgi:hypothetical protein